MYMYHFIIYGYTARTMAQLIAYENQCVCAHPAGYMIAVSQVQRQGIANLKPKGSQPGEIPLLFPLKARILLLIFKKSHNKIGYYAN